MIEVDYDWRSRADEIHEKLLRHKVRRLRYDTSPTGQRAYRLIAEMVAQGNLDYRQMAARLNNLHLSSPQHKKWRPDSLKQLVTHRLNPEIEVAARERVKRIQDANRAINDPIALKIKMNGCAACGVVLDPGDMHFDHIRGPKLGNPGNMVGGSPRRFKAEIEKCQVLCSKCHREKTNRERQELTRNLDIARMSGSMPSSLPINISRYEVLELFPLSDWELSGAPPDNFTNGNPHQA